MTRNADTETPGAEVEGGSVLERTLALVRHLRAHCPWDRKQTAESLVPHLLEEAAEVAQAVSEGSDEELAGELGDLLLNLAFQIVVGQEAGRFTCDEVFGRLEAKMIRRHPHVWGDETAAAAGPAAWERRKATERSAEESALAGIAQGLDPLTRSYRMQEKAAVVGFDWDDWQGAFDKCDEEMEEVREAVDDGPASAVESELGDLLFAVVNLARLLGVHPTVALARANRRFRERFQAMETLAVERGIAIPEAGLVLLDSLWDEVKRARRSADQAR